MSANHNAHRNLDPWVAVPAWLQMWEGHLFLWNNAEDQEDVLSLLSTTRATRDRIFAMATRLCIRNNVCVQSVMQFFNRFATPLGAPQWTDGKTFMTFPFLALQSINFWPTRMDFSSTLWKACGEYKSYEDAPTMTARPTPAQANSIMILMSQLPQLRSLKLPITLYNNDALDHVQPMPQLRELVLAMCFVPQVFPQIFPQLETLHLGELYFYDGSMYSRAVLPRSLTLLRCLNVRDGSLTFRSFNSAVFDATMRLLADSYNIRTLMLDELQNMPTNTATGLVDSADDMDDDNHARAQHDFEIIARFAALPCWKNVVHMSVPTFPWFRMQQYHRYRIARHDDPALDFVPDALRELVAPVRFSHLVTSFLLPTDGTTAVELTEDQAEVLHVAVQRASFYCPQYGLPTECRVRNIMIVSNDECINYGWHIHDQILNAEEHSVRDAIDHIAQLQPTTRIARNSLATWQHIRSNIVDTSVALANLMITIGNIPCKSTDWDLFEKDVVFLTGELDHMRQQFLRDQVNWRECTTDDATHATDVMLYFVDTMVWMIDGLMLIISLFEAMFTMGHNVAPILAKLRRTMHAMTKPTDPELAFLKRVILAVQRIVCADYARKIDHSYARRATLFQNYRLAQTYNTRANSTFEAFILMPILPLFDHYHALAFPQSTSTPP